MKQLAKAAAFGPRGRSLRAINATCGRHGRRRKPKRSRCSDGGSAEAEAASDRERPAAASPDPPVHILHMCRRWRRKGQPRHRSRATVERDRLGQNVKSRQRPEVCPCSVGELGGFHVMLTTQPEAPPWRRAAQRRQCGCDPKRDRHSPSTRIPWSCDRVEVPPSSCPPEPKPMALKAQHTISKLRKKLIRGGICCRSFGDMTGRRLVGPLERHISSSWAETAAVCCV